MKDKEVEWERVMKEKEDEWERMMKKEEGDKEGLEKLNEDLKVPPPVWKQSPVPERGSRSRAFLKNSTPHSWLRRNCRFKSKRR